MTCCCCCWGCDAALGGIGGAAFALSLILDFEGALIISDGSIATRPFDLADVGLGAAMGRKKLLTLMKAFDPRRELLISIDFAVARLHVEADSLSCRTHILAMWAIHVEP